MTLRGRYPGGPSRRPPEGEAGPKEERPRLPSVGEQETLASEGAQSRKARRRRKRATLAVLGAVLLAGMLGIWMGLRSHRTEEELARELQEERTTRGFDLEKQADRLINEIWKTEALEKIPPRR